MRISPIASRVFAVQNLNSNNKVNNFMSVPAMGIDSVNFKGHKPVVKDVNVDYETAKFVANSLSTSTSGHRAPYMGDKFTPEIVRLMTLGVADYAKKEELYTQIQEQALAIGIGIIDAERIDEINILQATFEAMRQALSQIQKSYACILVDGNKEIPQIGCKQEAIIGGDNKSASIAAASVIAKVTRDRMMEEYAKMYPEYDWESNKGYGSQKHYEAIAKYGITPLHRKSFLKNEGIK